jgi:hypothetical protein
MTEAAIGQPMPITVLRSERLLEFELRPSELTT